MQNFLKPTEQLCYETAKGELSFTIDEYLIINDNRQDPKLIITKSGIQKIEDFFEVKSDIPTIQQQWNTNQNFNIIVIANITSEYGTAFGIASANPLNLRNPISLAYGTEMAVKRSKATACLELLRKNYIGKEPIALLYSSYDEFDSENSVNKNLMPNTSKPTTNTSTKPNSNTNTNTNTNTSASASASATKSNDIKPQSETTKTSSESNMNTSSESTSLNEDGMPSKLFTRKYEDGISLSELYSQDKEYLKCLAERPNKYRETTLKFLQQNNLSVAQL